MNASSKYLEKRKLFYNTNQALTWKTKQDLNYIIQ
jgi:hypothetical protein